MSEDTDHSSKAQALLQVAQRVSLRHWCPATGGNFSVRVAENRFLMTRSGCDKSRLSDADLLLCDAQGQPLHSDARPSDETALHMRLYQLDPQIGCVLHSHSVTATVLSRQPATPSLRIQGFEMQKSLAGQHNPNDPVLLRILENNQNIEQLADETETLWKGGEILCPGLLVRGHGLYAWGADCAAALRHLEGLEFLLECLWQERLASGSNP